MSKQYYTNKNKLEDELTEEDFGSLSIHSIKRIVNRQENSLFNHLRSVDHDSKFVKHISLCYRKYPLVANLRCGAWYSGNFDYSCYFRSTDGHYGNWRFSLTRLNLNIIDVVIKHDGCLVVDSTKRGKKFPDSFTRTIPIWITVINRCLYQLKQQKTMNNDAWSELYTPKWVAESERDQMLKMVDSYCKLLIEHKDTLDLAGYANRLSKPLRPLWLSVETQPILLDYQDSDETSSNNLEFHPLYLLSCSDFREEKKPFRAYIQGAGDDDENWSNGLTPQLYWSNYDDIMSKETDELLENYIKQLVHNEKTKKEIIIFNNNDSEQHNSTESNESFIVIDNTNITISSSKDLSNVWSSYDFIINCSLANYVIGEDDDEKIKNCYVHIPMKDGKLAKNDLVENLKLCEKWIISKLNEANQDKKKILIHSVNGLHNCVCILTVLLSKHLQLLTNNVEKFDFINKQNNNKLSKSDITKLYLFIEKHCPSSLPHKSIRNALNNYLLSNNISFK